MRLACCRMPLLLLFLSVWAGLAALEQWSMPGAGPHAASPPPQTARLGVHHHDDFEVGPQTDLGRLGHTPCRDGRADRFPCSGVDLLSFVPLSELGGEGAVAVRANDIWGWTDATTGKEYALVGLTTSTAFVDITNPESPLVLGRLPTHNRGSPWRDLKVYRDHLFVVSEAQGHGMQVFDLAGLRGVSAPPVIFSMTAHYTAEGLSNAHNIAINTETGFAYVVGTNTCGGGLHMVDIRNPSQPAFAGCYRDDAYTHDAQCAVYQGADGEHRGREICFNANEDTLTIVDVTDKSAPRQLSRSSYPGFGYLHQGWLTEDHLYFLLGDELDEQSWNHNTRTYLWDMSDLDRPLLIGSYTASTAAIDHNLYVHRDRVYQANYRAGLRILALDGIAQGQLRELGFFDVWPDDDAAQFNGAWSVYPFFPSGVVVVSGIEQGLFVLQPQLN